jgi:hypothetical protein
MLGRPLLAHSGEAHGGDRRICHDADIVTIKTHFDVRAGRRC